MKLFRLLDGIVNSDYAEEILSDSAAVIDYAEASRESITREQAEKILAVGKRWLGEQENGNGEWTRMRHDAINALSE